MKRRRIAAMGLVAAGLLTGACQPQNGSNGGGNNPPPAHAGNAGRIEITWNIRGITQEDSYAAANSGHQDRYILNALSGPGPVASVTADQTSKGTLLCIITYISGDGKYYIVDEAHDNNPGSVTCRSDNGKVGYALKHYRGLTAPANGILDPSCPCNPGTLILNVTWLGRSGRA